MHWIDGKAIRSDNVKKYYPYGNIIMELCSENNLVIKWTKYRRDCVRVLASWDWKNYYLRRQICNNKNYNVLKSIHSPRTEFSNLVTPLNFGFFVIYEITNKTRAVNGASYGKQLIELWMKCPRMMHSCFFE